MIQTAIIPSLISRKVILPSRYQVIYSKEWGQWYIQKVFPWFVIPRVADLRESELSKSSMRKREISPLPPFGVYQVPVFESPNDAIKEVALIREERNSKDNPGVVVIG